MDEEYDKALDRAMRLLAVRARSRRELVDRLARLGFGRRTVKAVEARLVDLGLIDDREFALESVRHLLASGRSTSLTKRKLLAQGIPENTVEDVMAGVEVGASDTDRAVALARQRAASCRDLPDSKAFQRVARYLYSKGYGPEVASEACRTVFGEADAND